MEEQGKTIQKIDAKQAYDKQIRLLITQYSKGYFPLWMIENFSEIRQPIVDFWKVFQKSDRKELIK